MGSLAGVDVGRYHIVERLGQGGMATVYKAYDTRLEREVALKFIRRDAIVPQHYAQMLKRFEREAKSLAKLSHANIVKVHDYGEYEGEPYLVMEYLEGGSLKDRVGQPMPYLEALDLLIPVGRALAYAHRRGVIHRDVKPANILLDEAGQPHLGDFGIAKILDVEASTHLTGSGVGVGTPKYMAPEQWRGETSPRTDIYALGVVLYELVTGRPPYDADTPAAILMKQISDPLPRPRDFVAELPEAVEWVLYKALAKAPEERYVDMAAFVTALEGLRQLEGRVAEPRRGSGESLLETVAEGRVADVAGLAPSPLPSAGDVAERAPSPLPPVVEGAGRAVSPLPAVGEGLGGEGDLPAALAQAVASPYVSLRLGAVEELGRLYAGEDTRLVGASEAALRRLERDADWRVAEAARRALAAPSPLPLRVAPQQQPWAGGLRRWLWPLVGWGGLVVVLSGVVIWLMIWPIVRAVVVPPTAEPAAVAVVTEDLATAMPTSLPATFTPLPATAPPACTAVGQAWVNPKDGMRLLCVPAGEFLMGSAGSDSQAEDDEKPQHTVYLDGYWMYATEVTNAMYARCAAEGACTPPGGFSSSTRSAYYGEAQYADYPVINVDWHQAAAYCSWAGGRLPSEAEWEKGARGTDGRLYPWGDGALRGDLLNYCDRNCPADWKDNEVDDGYGDTAPVGSYPLGASPYGLLDMAGNVWEWVADWYSETYYANSPYANPPEPESGDDRVLRGGSWLDGSRIVRAADRLRNDPVSWYYLRGFRCVR